VASLPAELDPVLYIEGTLEQYRQLDAQVLLIYGSETENQASAVPGQGWSTVAARTRSAATPRDGRSGLVGRTDCDPAHLALSHVAADLKAEDVTVERQRLVRVVVRQIGV
jgi:hypothetical protein